MKVNPSYKKMKYLNKESLLKLTANSKQNIFSNISDIAKTEEEKNFIINSKNIFFTINKSKTIFIYAILYNIDKIYNKINYKPLNVYNELYEELRTIFKQKSFNKAEFVKILSCENKKILNYNDYLEIRKSLFCEYNNMVSDDMKITDFEKEKKSINKEDIDLKSELNNIFKNERYKQVIQKRAEGKTLDDIGKEFSITRERARQIEIKPKIAIEMWLEKRKEDILHLSNTPIVNSKILKKHFGNDLFDIIKYCTEKHKGKITEWIYVEELDSFIYGKTLYEKLLSSVIENSKKTNKVQDVYDDLKEEFPYLTINNIVTFCNNSKNVFLYDDVIRSEKLTIGKSIILAVQTDYKNGINIGDKKELSEFKKYLNKKYNLNIKTDRALIARIQDVLIMSDNTIYSYNKLEEKNSNINKLIVDYMNELKEDRVTYQKMFNDIKDNILETDIKSYSALHGYIRKNKDILNIKPLRYYVCKNNTENLLSSGYFVQLINFIKEKNRPVSMTEILSNFTDWTNLYPKYAMNYYPQIVQWEKNVFYDVSLIDMSDEDNKKINLLLEKALNNKYKYTNEYILFNMFKKEMNSFLDSNNICNASQLYFVLKFYCKNNNISFSKPHIVNFKLNNNKFTTEDFINIIIGKKTSFSKKDIRNKINKYYGEKNSSLDLATQNVFNNYIRIDKDTMILKSKYKITNKDIVKIKDFINKNLDKNPYLVPEKIEDFSELPEAPFKWNSWSLCEIIKLYIDDFDIISKKKNIVENTMIIAKKDCFKSKEELVKYIFNNEYKGKNDITEMLNYAKELGIYSKNYNINSFKEDIK